MKSRVAVGDQFTLQYGKLFYRRLGGGNICQGPTIWCSTGSQVTVVAVGPRSERLLVKGQEARVQRLLVKAQIDGADAYAWVYATDLERSGT